MLAHRALQEWITAACGFLFPDAIPGVLPGSGKKSKKKKKGGGKEERTKE